MQRPRVEPLVPHAGDVEAGHRRAEHAALGAAGAFGRLDEHQLRLVDDALGLDLAQRDQATGDACEVRNGALKEHQHRLALRDAKALGGRAEHERLVAVAPPGRDRAGERFKTLWLEHVGQRGEQRLARLERGFSRLTAQLEGADLMIERNQGVEIARRRVAMCVGDGGAVGARDGVEKPVPARPLEAPGIADGLVVEPSLEAVGVVERPGRERGVRDL